MILSCNFYQHPAMYQETSRINSKLVLFTHKPETFLFGPFHVIYNTELAPPTKQQLQNFQRRLAKQTNIKPKLVFPSVHYIKSLGGKKCKIQLGIRKKLTSSFLDLSLILYSIMTSSNLHYKMCIKAVKNIGIPQFLPNLIKNPFWFSDDPFSVQTSLKNQIGFLKNPFAFKLSSTKTTLKTHLAL